MTAHEWQTVKEYADDYRVTPRTVYRWVEQGIVPVKRTPSGQIRIKADDKECRPSV